MYKTVWNFMNHHVKSSHVSAMFLAALLAGWTLIGLLAGSVVCLISTISLSTKAVVLFGDDYHQCSGSGGQRTDPGGGGLSSGKGSAAAYQDYRQGT